MYRRISRMLHRAGDGCRCRRDGPLLHREHSRACRAAYWWSSQAWYGWPLLRRFDV